MAPSLNDAGRMTPAGRMVTVATRPARWPLILVAAALLATAFGLWHWQQAGPSTVAGFELTGLRGPGCVELAVLVDNSGSMTSAAAARAAAVQQIQGWAPSQGVLRSNDEILVIDWADNAQLTFPITPISAINHVVRAPVDASVVGSGTDVEPALNMLMAQPHHGCAITVLSISDGLISPVPDPMGLQSRLAAAGVHRITLLNPSSTNAPAEWVAMADSDTSVSISDTDPDGLAIAIGEQIAAATGQTLNPR
jgi:hypothetical protein